MIERRMVIQYDLFGHRLCKFPSIADAARHVNGVTPPICKCCRGETPSAYGFRWSYAEDESISEMEYSMILERAFGEITNIMHIAMQRATQQRKEALEAGEQDPVHLRLVMDELQILKKKYRKRADDAYNEHRKKANVDQRGIENIANAILERMALDYESALCDKDEAVKSEVEDFAKKNKHKYSAIDAEDILSRIRSSHKKFKDRAHKDIIGILEVTDEFRKTRHAFSERNNPYRCPLCGGGMYVKSRLKSNSYLVGCSGCNLTEVVDITK